MVVAAVMALIMLSLLALEEVWFVWIEPFLVEIMHVPFENSSYRGSTRMGKMLRRTFRNRNALRRVVSASGTIALTGAWVVVMTHVI